MRNLMFAIAPLLMSVSSPAAAASGVAELVGTYNLKQKLSGSCYPQITAVMETFRAGHAGLGIYGRPGSGEIVFQFEAVNGGPMSTPQTNPMTGEDFGYHNSTAVISEGKILASEENVDFAGQVNFRREIKGEFGGGALSFEVSDINNIVRPSTATHASCVYTKLN